MPLPEHSPFVTAFLFFFSIVFLRTQATYWIARYVSYMSFKRADIKNPTLRRIAAWVQRSGEGKGSRALERWGLPAVFFSFFMTGTKTVINAAAGLAQMRFWVWIWPMVLGCLAHATIYATVGWAAWTAALSAAAGSPLGAALILLAAAGIVFYVLHRSGRRRLAAAIQSGQGDPAGAGGADRAGAGAEPTSVQPAHGDATPAEPTPTRNSH